ncbi:MAG: sugar transferase [Deltaproteobacteria bacterium]|nr:sugar transferase [Deltaproteobacteria bacterium]
MKRLMDILLSGLSLVCFFPFGLVIVLILRLTGEGEIFFLQSRVGKGGEIFGLMKFATMLKDSPNIGTGVLTVKNDPRVLPFGKFLRKTKLNEVPQLWNILKGDMSIIGPRPQAQKHFDVFPEHVKKEIVKVRPGLSGVGSIIFRDEENIMGKSPKPNEACYAEDIAPYKGELEIWYIKNQSLWLDLKLIFLTIWVVLFPESNLPFKILTDLPKSNNKIFR